MGDTVDVLMIDDNDLQLEYLTDLFEKHGLATQTLNDSTKAVDTIRHIKPKLVILDLMMPSLTVLPF